MIKKYIGVCGSIESIKLGDYFNRTSNKKKRRTIYFALVTFKTQESLEKALKPDSLQGRVNLMIKHDLAPAFKSLEVSYDHLYRKNRKKRNSKIG